MFRLVLDLEDSGQALLEAQRWNVNAHQTRRLSSGTSGCTDGSPGERGVFRLVASETPSQRFSSEGQPL